MRRSFLAACVGLSLGALGCPDEPGKVRGRVSRGSSTAASPEPRHRFVLDSGSAHFAMPVLRAARRRLEPVGVAAASASIRGQKVVVDVDGDLREKADAALAGRRLDVLADGEILIRGESLAGAKSDAGMLLLSFEGTARTALNRAISEGGAIAVKLDGAVVARYEAKEYQGIDREAGTLSVKLDGGRARESAKMLPGQALSHRTKLEHRVIE